MRLEAWEPIENERLAWGRAVLRKDLRLVKACSSSRRYPMRVSIRFVLW